jgi:hypothetical protein
MVYAAVLAAVTVFECRGVTPQTTIIEDTLYKADGTRFEGVASIQWKSFQSSAGTEVPQNLITIQLINGYLRVPLIPTTTALSPAYYEVRYSSGGRSQFVEYWSVPPSAIPLKLMEVRTHGPVASPITTPPPVVAIQDVAGLRTELDLRPSRGASWMPSRAAVIGGTGHLEGAIGNAGDCVHVDGTSGPCGLGGVTFVDGETPSGVTDGVNTQFALSAPPAPAASLKLFRNGLLLRQGAEYTLTDATILLAPGMAPANGDLMQAWYRLSSDSPTILWTDGEAPAGAVDGVNRQFTLSEIPLPASSLQVYRNGILQKVGVDYMVAVNTITFLSVSTPQPGDILQASYRR